MVTWAVIGYSFAFSEGNGIIGGFDHAFLKDVGLTARDGTTIPHVLFMVFQATFCIITTALVSGAVVERMRFGPYLVFAALWSVLVYAVLAHWAFGGGWLQSQGTLDFAGGIPVEMASGFSALAAALVVGARKDYGRARRSFPTTPPTSCSAPGCCGSAGSGSTAAAGSRPATPARSRSRTRSCTPACCLVMWFFLDLIRGGKVTAIGAATAIIVGCVGITPAGGFISPGWAMALGFLAALPSYAIIVWRPRTRVDETLDVLAAHGIAGLTGILFIGFFAQLDWNGVADGLFYGDAAQLGEQALAVLVTPVYAFCATYVLLRLMGALHVAALDRARGGDRDGRRPPRRGGLRHRRGRDPRHTRHRGRGRAAGRSPTRADHPGAIRPTTAPRCRSPSPAPSSPGRRRRPCP